MENQPSFDRSLLVPIGVGIFSLLGLCVILIGGRLNSARATVEAVPSATPFQYAFIGTEPAISTVTMETPGTAETLDEQEFPTETPLFLESPAYPPPSTAGNQSTNTAPSVITLPPLVTPNTPSRTPTSAFAAPFGAGTFDDTDSRFVYGGDWKTIAGSNYQSTLHVSDTLGNTNRFLFIGNELRVFFQAGPSLGTIRLTLDTTSYVMSEASSTTQNYEWVLTASTIGTHTVVISHESGGSVNFNYIIVPEVPRTPTNTATSTGS